jgi:hypothetical protein
MMDFHGGDNLLSDCLTSIRCWLDILPLGARVLLKVWWIPFMMATWIGSVAWRISYLGGGALCTLEEGIKPYIAWGCLDSCLEVWSWLGDTSYTTMFLQRVANLVEYMD